VRGVRDQEGDDPAAVQAIDELEGVDPHLPAELCVPGPDTAVPHHGLQRDLDIDLGAERHEATAFALD
jgi:hypothetical protein